MFPSRQGSISGPDLLNVYCGSPLRIDIPVQARLFDYNDEVAVLIHTENIYGGDLDNDTKYIGVNIESKMSFGKERTKLPEEWLPSAGSLPTSVVNAPA